LKKARKRRKWEPQRGGFTVPFFLPFFHSLFRWISFSFPAGNFFFSLFNIFYISELKRRKIPGEKQWEPQKARKKGEKKGKKKGTVNNPNILGVIATPDSWCNLNGYVCTASVFSGLLPSSLPLLSTSFPCSDSAYPTLFHAV
jgi:hypothetical protein